MSCIERQNFNLLGAINKQPVWHITAQQTKPILRSMKKMGKGTWSKFL